MVLEIEHYKYTLDWKNRGYFRIEKATNGS